MASVLQLQHGALRCDIVPALGGCISGMWLHGLPVLRSTPGAALESVRQSGSYPLIPYSNRIGQARLLWQGAERALVPNFAPEPHAIHGVGWERSWSVEYRDAHSARLRYVHRADAAWPFAFEGVQSFTLEADALTQRLEITNLEPQPAPAGLGWHPYFTKHPDSHVAFGAQGRWEMQPDMLPSGLLPHAGLDVDCQPLQVDHCFEAWNGQAVLHGGGLRVRISSDLDRLVVFTHPGRTDIAIEPVSHANNALALAAARGVAPQTLGVRVLQPGAAFAATMRTALEDLR